MFNSRPKPSHIAAQIKTEYSPNSPAMRLTLVSYMLQHGLPDTFEGTPTEFLNDVLTFISGGYAEFITELDALYVDEPEQGEDKTMNDVIEFDPNRSPYL